MYLINVLNDTDRYVFSLHVFAVSKCSGCVRYVVIPDYEKIMSPPVARNVALLVLLESQ